MEDLIERLKANNCDVDGAVKRIGKLESYLMIVNRFDGDRSVEEYRAAFAGQDYETAFRCVHTVKGLAASFGFADLQKAAAALTNALREKRYDEAERLNADLFDQHKKIVAILKECR